MEESSKNGSTKRKYTKKSTVKPESQKFDTAKSA